MKILHVFKLYTPDRGGIIRIIELLTTGLGKETASQVLAAKHQGWGETRCDNGVFIRKVTSLGSLLAMPLAPSLFFWLWRYARKVDVVNYHFPFPLVDLAISLWFPRHTALVIHWHSEIIAQKKVAYFISPLIRRCLRKADRIIVSTPAHIEQSPYLQHVRAKCEVIPFGIDAGLWRIENAAEATEVEALKKKYPRLVLAIGRLVPYKGFAVLIDALPAIAGTVLIVGAGPLQNTLEQQAKQLSVQQKVHFLGDVSQQELKILFHACDLFVLPSTGDNETFGIVQLEAMVCGKPIVNTALNTGVPWVARDGLEAITVPPNDPARLAQAVNKLLDSPELAIELGRQAQDRALTVFNQQNFLQHTYDVYRSVIAAKKT